MMQGKKVAPSGWCPDSIRNGHKIRSVQHHVTADTLVLAARGYAALHQLTSITVVINPDPQDVPVYVDRQTNAVVIQAGLPLEEFVLLMQAGVDALCRATVVERDDGDGTEWASDGAEWTAGVAADGTHGPSTVASRARPVLRLV